MVLARVLAGVRVCSRKIAYAGVKIRSGTAHCFCGSDRRLASEEAVSMRERVRHKDYSYYE